MDLVGMSNGAIHELFGERVDGVIQFHHHDLLRLSSGEDSAKSENRNCDSNEISVQGSHVPSSTTPTVSPKRARRAGHNGYGIVCLLTTSRFSAMAAGFFGSSASAWSALFSATSR